MAAGNSRFDKYDPLSGGFRAVLGFAVVAADVGNIWAVALNASGQVVKANVTQTHADVVGVICPTKAMASGDTIDVMTAGEIVQATASDGTTALTAGTRYFAAAANDGTIAAIASPTAATNYTRLGQTVEAARLVVRVEHVQG